MFKPAIAWVRQEDKFKPDPDTFMQRFLYLGIFPMAPFPQNDHSIMPSPEGDIIYTDYGPLFTAMRGRKWVLLPYSVQINQGNAKANLFQVPQGYVVPVTFGGSAASSTITLQGLPEILAGKKLKCEVLHPGKEGWTDCPARQTSTQLSTKVPLRRGCAMVRVTA